MRRKIRELEPNPVLRLIDRGRPGTDIYSWASELKGEQRTVRRLRRLRGHGWLILHAVQWATGTGIDHLAIGPAGVFVINSKRHPGKTLWYGDRAVTVNGAPTRHIAASQSEARKVSRTLSRPCGFQVPVRPVISVVDAAKLSVKSANPPVLVLEVEHLDRVVPGLTPTLSTDQVAHMYEVARRGRTWSG
ncbi:nuclease-related domain-containing protein [Streptomyces bauhiniae]|uniref:nuclease-related domain-containing protein n=1 Tax=Streptomyces bauhiniae TaxID=2340725 RepID=UPI003316D385